MPEQIYEIKIKPVNELSIPAQVEVMEKLKKMPEKSRCNYAGYAAVAYVRASPLKIISVDPIEGTIIDYFNSALTACKQ
ncbi:MAG: hypothetical protein V1676_00595 [Candidatus Diapherotrites archaeon]